MEMKYCRRCGEPIRAINSVSYDCPNGHTLYINSAPASAVFPIDAEGYILLARRGVEPGLGKLDALGGFVDGVETFEEAAVRELEEESSLHPSDYEPITYLCSGSTLYSYDNEDRWVLTACFWTRLKPDATPVAGDDVAEIVKLKPEDVDLNDFYGEDVKDGFSKLYSLLSS